MRVHGTVFVVMARPDYLWRSEFIRHHENLAWARMENNDHAQANSVVTNF